MKMMNTEEYIGKIDELLKKVAEKHPAYSIRQKSDITKEADGQLQFIFTIKNKEMKKAPEYKLPLYIFEGRKHITAFIISARTLKLLFENSTMDSPNVALHYLEGILDAEIAWIKDLEEQVKKQQEAAAKKRAAKMNKGGKKPFNKGNKAPQKGGKPYTGNGSKKPYQKPSGKGASKKFGNNSRPMNNSGKSIKTYNNKGGNR